MKTIKTLNGPIAPDQLGFCDIHEHLWKSGGMEVIEDGGDFAIEDLEKSVPNSRAMWRQGANPH